MSYTSIRLEEINPEVIGYSLKKREEVSVDKPVKEPITVVPTDTYGYYKVKEDKPSDIPMRGKANLVREVMMGSDVENDVVAAYLGEKTEDFIDMLGEDIFDFEDILKACHACGYQILVKKPNQPLNMAITLKLSDFLDEDEITRLSNVKDLIYHRRKKRFEEIEAEYNKLKLQLGLE